MTMEPTLNRARNVVQKGITELMDFGRAVLAEGKRAAAKMVAVEARKEEEKEAAVAVKVAEEAMEKEEEKKEKAEKVNGIN